MSLDIEVLYAKYHAHIHGYVARRMQGHDDAVIEDVVADVWERALRSASRYQDRGAHPKGWLYMIAHHLIVDRYRERFRPVTFCRLGDLKPFVTHVGTDDHVSQLDSQITISKALATYQTGNSHWPPDLHLAVIHERFFVGGTDAEIGARLGMTEMATKQVRKRAMANLRKKLGAA